MAVEPVTRVERLLALILLHDMHDAADQDKAVRLAAAGLPNGEIASLLGTTSAVVSQHLYAARHPRKRPGKKKKAKTGG
jgi:hypothetical protein